MTDYDDGGARDLAAQRKIIDAARAMLAALEAVSFSLDAFYDSSEDNRHNPTMQQVGRDLKRASAAIAQAKAAGIKMEG